MSETPQERAQAWCEEHAEHKSVPGTKFVSGRLLCSRDDVVKLLQPLEAEVERLRDILRDLFEDAGGGFPNNDWSINPGLNSVQALIRFMREGR